MEKSDFIWLYPDVCKQELDFTSVLSRKEVEKNLIFLCDSMCTGMLAYERSGKKATVFTSKKFLAFLKHMTEGNTVTDLNGETHEIISKEPFLCSGEYCIRTRNNGSEDVYHCTFFNPEK